MKIIIYKKHITPSVTISLALPMDSTGQMQGTELATLSDGLTYVSVPASTTLPPQPKEIAASVQVGKLTPAQISEIKTVSPHIKLINDRVCERIRAKYSLDDELKLARISIGHLQGTYQATPVELQSIADYQIEVESARLWGRDEKARLGIA